MDTEKLKSVAAWFSGKISVIPAEFHCQTRDVFHARLQTCLTFLSEPEKLGDESLLLCSVLGEIGNNVFDHNLGKWRDVPGLWFSYDWNGKGVFVLLADCGQGFKKSLQNVKPDIATDEEAIKLAFEVRISGRAPERRGNGLKYVRSVVNGHLKRGLVCYSGSASTSLGGKSAEVKSEIPLILGGGVFFCVYWGQL